MLSIWKEKETSYGNSDCIYAEIAEEMSKNYGFLGFSGSQLRYRLNNLKTRFRTLKNNGNQEKLQSWPYFEFFNDSEWTYEVCYMFELRLYVYM